MVIPALIFDRTGDDVLAARRIRGKVQSGVPLTDAEQAAYDAGLRGCYNATDYNRVGAAVNALAAFLREIYAWKSAYLAAHGVAEDEQYRIPWKADIAITGRVDWTVHDVPTEAEMAAYIGCIASLLRILHAEYDYDVLDTVLVFNAPYPLVDGTLTLEMQTAYDGERRSLHLLLPPEIAALSPVRTVDDANRLERALYHAFTVTNETQDKIKHLIDNTIYPLYGMEECEPL